MPFPITNFVFSFTEALGTSTSARSPTVFISGSGTSMRIGVLGTGMVGQAIGTKLISLGHSVRMGSRTANNQKAKVLIDVSNPLDFSKGMPPSLFVSNSDSLAEQIQRAFPDAAEMILPLWIRLFGALGNANFNFKIVRGK